MHRGAFGKVIKFGFAALVGGVFFIACTHNCQPWIVVGKDIVAGLEVIPNPSLFGWRPLAWMTTTGGTVFGAILWAFCQSVQLIPILIDNPDFMADFISGSNRNQYQLAGDGSFVDGMKAKYNDQPKSWWRHMKLLALGAYLVEVCIALFRFPVYSGGNLALWNDITAGTYAPAFLDKENIVMLLLTIFAVEVVLWVAIWAWKGIRWFGMQPAKA